MQQRDLRFEEPGTHQGLVEKHQKLRTSEDWKNRTSAYWKPGALRTNLETKLPRPTLARRGFAARGLVGATAGDGSSSTACRRLHVAWLQMESFWTIQNGVNQPLPDVSDPIAPLTSRTSVASISYVEIYSFAFVLIIVSPDSTEGPSSQQLI